LIWIVNLHVDNVGDVTWNKDAFERLVLPSRTKDLIKALVMVRALKQGKRQDANPVLKRDDIIESKGNGLIILLHGGPGTGKTLTAGELRIHADRCCANMKCREVCTVPPCV
jgi:SpoVK/Ycf46/Vps4 family AAA+-type ATPase